MHDPNDPQGTETAQTLARLYGISPEQAQQVVSAVMPAFQLGLERSAQNQASMLGLLGTMARNPYADTLQNPALGFTSQIRDQGNEALGALFGSPDVSRAVAVQAAATSGLSSALIKQMLPVIASMVLGSLMKGGNASGGASNPLQDLLGGLLGGGQSRAGGAGAANPLQDLLGGMFGGGASSSQQSGGARSANPLEDLLGGMFGGGAGNAAPPSRNEPAGPRSGNPLEDLLGGMLGGGGQSRSGGSSGSANPLQDLLGGMFGGGASGGTPATDDETTQPRANDPRTQPFQDIFDQFFDPKSGSRR